MAVVPVAWQATCDRCGEVSPEIQDSIERAQRDLDDCPCWEEAPVELSRR